MRDFYVIGIQSDKKNINISPLIGFHMENFFAKLKYTCQTSILGKSIKDCIKYIEYEESKNQDSLRWLDNEKDIPWKKRGMVSLSKMKNGNYYIYSEYFNHTIMSPSEIECYELPSDISDEELGNTIIIALDQSFNYSLRKEFGVYYSDNDGLLFVPMALNRTGFVMADYCCCVKNPYDSLQIFTAINDVLNFISENPEDKRTTKERKNTLPWHNYTKYKSYHGFVKTHHCIEIHVLKNGEYVFIPTLRSDSYDSGFVVYDRLKSTCTRRITPDIIKDEIFSALEICDLIYKKSKEEDNSCHHDKFFDYVYKLSLTRNNKLISINDFK